MRQHPTNPPDQLPAAVERLLVPTLDRTPAELVLEHLRRRLVRLSPLLGERLILGTKLVEPVAITGSTLGRARNAPALASTARNTSRSAVVGSRCRRRRFPGSGIRAVVMCATTQLYIDLAGETFRDEAELLERRLWGGPVPPSGTNVSDEATAEVATPV
jgi:hypothetical protein